MNPTDSLLGAPPLAPPDDLTPPDSPSDAEPASGARRPPLFPFLLAYWKSDDRWKALALLGTILVILFGTAYLAVWANQLVGAVTDALVNRKWDALTTALVTSVAVGVTVTAVRISSTALTDLLDLRWRTWLTYDYLTRWTQASKFYDVERDGLLKNADQRIAEDVRLFTDKSLNLFTSLCSTTVQIVTFTVVLWQLSQSLKFDLGGRTYEVHGYMVYIAFAYGIGALVVTHIFGRQLIPLNMERQGVEADYRYLGMQLRENAEQVAFYRGGEREHVRLIERFAFVRQNFLRTVFRTWKVEFARNTYGTFFVPLPTLAALPLYFTGQLTFGGLTRAAAAFRTLEDALSYFSQAYVGFTNWYAITNRLRDLSAALDAAQARQSGFVLQRAEQASISTGELHLHAPDGASLATVPPLRLGPGERWLIRGPSGAGKSTLLRAIAGIWPHGRGHITLPAQAAMLFLPQRSYIPSGSLKAAICYPSAPSHFNEEQCRQALEQSGLGHLAVSLDSIDHWQQKLSGGEQQRLAFSRVFLQRPAFIFLDEATSALDPPTEQRLYQAVLSQLLQSTVVSVAHRESLAAFHDKTLELVPHQARRLGQLSGEPTQYR